MKKILVILAMIMASLFMTTPAEATTCAGWQSEINRTTFGVPAQAVYSEIIYRICTGNAGNQFADLSHANIGYDWNAGNYPCSGYAALEGVTFDTKFWDSDTTWYDYGPITLPCVSSGQYNFVLQLSNAPNYRIDQGARWQNVIHVTLNNAPDWDVTHGGRYY